MYRFNRGLARRVGELEKRLKATPIPPTPEELARADARRLELTSAALGEGPAASDLTEKEVELFQKARQHAPVFQELLESGALDAYTSAETVVTMSWATRESTATRRPCGRP